MENKSNKLWMIILTVVICVILLGVLLIALLLGTDIPALRGMKAQVSEMLGIATQLPEATEPDATEPEATVPLNVKSYTVDDETAKKNSGNVVATAGDAKLTNGELQVYYWMSIYDFVSQYSMYLSYMGVDFKQPLDQQLYDPSTNTTWQQIMIENALQTWHQYNAIKQLAEAEGYELDAEGQEYVANIDQNIANMMAQTEYTSVEEMLEGEMGAGTTEEAYRNFMMAGFIAIEYLADKETEITPTLEQIDAYYTEKEDYFTQNGLVKDSGALVDVRHVLIEPEGGTPNADGRTKTYTDEEWEACRVKAQELLDQWRSGEATEETFAQLAVDNSADGNASEGGLYTGVTEGYMVEAFNDWIFDESREYGDTDLVKTPFGYHIMFFVKREQGEPKWISTVRAQYLQEKISTIIQDATRQYPLETDYDAIGISQAKTS